VALLEPIGFSTCSMKFQREAAAAIESLNIGDRFGIVHDTFQHALAKDADFPSRTSALSISPVSPTAPAI
jgi:2-keto-myo-inositol isomerase